MILQASRHRVLIYALLIFIIFVLVSSLLVNFHSNSNSNTDNQPSQSSSTITTEGTINFGSILNNMASTSSSTSSSSSIASSSSTSFESDIELTLSNRRLSPSTVQYMPLYKGERVSYRDAMILLKSGNQKLIHLIKESIINFDAKETFFECPPTTLETSSVDPFEYVLISASALKDVSVDPKPFTSHFQSNPTADIVAFHNLGRDAFLVVPSPSASDNTVYTHLSKFVHGGPSKQVDRLFQEVGFHFESQLASNPGKRMWCSTSGLGVYWLHVRIDTVPKYYNFKPYKI